MRRLLFGMLILGLFAAPAAAQGQQRSNAPTAGLSATNEGRLDWQMSKVIFSNWGGEEYDNSFPPVGWPKAMRTRGTELTITINTAEMPDSVGVRMWKELRRNGIPRGKRKDVQCYLDAGPGECALKPSISGDGLAWNVVFEPPWRGRIYLATSAQWPQAQVAWINHAILKR